MNTAFLSEQDLLQVQSIMADHGLTRFDASIRLWGRGKAIDVSGTLGTRELSCLLAIARYLGEPADEPPAASCAAAHAGVLPYATLITPLQAQA